MEGEFDKDALGFEDSQPLLEDHEEDEKGEDKNFNIMEIISSICKQSGIMWCLLAGIGQASQLVVLGEVAHLVSPMAATFIRSSFLFVFFLSVSWQPSQEYDWLDILYNIAFGFFDVMGLCFSAVAMLYTTTSDVSAIVFNEPIPVAIMACIFLGEGFDVKDGALALINGIGLVFICKTSTDNSERPDGSSSVFGIMLSFGGLLCWSLMALMGRALAHRNREDPSLLLVVVGLNGVLWSSVYLTITSSWNFPETSHDQLMCLLLGIVSALGAYAYARVLKTEDGLLVAVSLTLCIPLTIFYDIVFKGRIVIWQTIVGVCFTIGSTICLYIKSYLPTC